jgi:P-type Ca2+ transporter type 2C
MKKFTQRPFYTMSSSASLLHLQTTTKGLSDFDAAGRLSAFGSNTLPKRKKMSQMQLFFRQFNNPLIYIVIVAAIISLFMGHVIDAGFIMFVVLLNTIVGYLQENKAEKSLEKLYDSIQQNVRVIRNGVKKKVSAEDVVVGDIVDLMAGDKISTDGRLINVFDLHVNESMLTGEWQDVRKNVDMIEEDVIVSDQKNMVFAGTSVTQGHGLCVVTATGIDTEIGKISDYVHNTVEEKTPLQKKFFELSRIIGGVVFVAIIIFSIVGILRGQSIETVFIAATALTVSAIPEGLLPAVTVVLIFGMRRLAKYRALVRKLNASETMGAITTICADKTGTLTMGEMRVSHILTGSNELLEFKDGADFKYVKNDDIHGHVKALEIASIVNDAYLENLNDPHTEIIAHGRPTDRALLIAATQAGIEIDSYRTEHPEIDQELFRSENKYAVRVHEHSDGKVRIMILGAPEVLLDKVDFIDVNNVRMPFNSQEGEKLRKTLEELTQKGLRVLACGERILTRETYDRLSKSERYDNMTLVGYIALKDPLRREVEQSLSEAENAGIRLIVITGDHAATARSVMLELGHSVPAANIRLGSDLKELSDDELQDLVKHVEIFARVLPEHKIRIVRALQKNDEIVAMVGDGINDAPAIKASNVGISVGNGTDVAKEVSDIILLDSSFTTIVKAIEQGRVIYENIRRILIYLVSDNFSAIFVFFIAALFGWPLPLLPIQVLWINVIEDSFPNIALTTEYDSKNLMNDPPRKPRESIISREYKKFMALVFLVSGISAVFIFWLVWKFFGDISMARTATFTLIAFDSLAFVYVIRNFRRFIFRTDIFSNTILNISVIVSLGLLFAGIYVPFLAKYLGTVPLDFTIWIIVIAITFAEVVLFEVAKSIFFMRRKIT